MYIDKKENSEVRIRTHTMRPVSILKIVKIHSSTVLQLTRFHYFIHIT